MIKIVHLKKDGKAYIAKKVPGGWLLLQRVPEKDKSGVNYGALMRAEENYKQDSELLNELVKLDL